MTNMVRTQLLLRDDQREALDRIARDTDGSLSEIVRSFIDAQLRQYQYRQMREAAESLRNDYAKGGALDMRELDAEDFMEWSGDAQG